MLKEITSVRQLPGEHRRRWFTSVTMDLVVWVDEAGTPVRFQFCYDKGSAERALTWNADSGFSHMAVDDGENMGGMGYKASPILVADGSLDRTRVRQIFLENSSFMPAEITDFVSQKIDAYRPELNHPSDQHLERGDA
jgi:hypothetical protein